MKFEVGQVVTCVNAKVLKGNSVGPSLEEGEAYSVKQVLECPSCHTDHLDVGLEREFESITCYDCGQELPSSTIAYCHPSRFI